ncbi:MAG TPA: YggS family pyridoxal phosphate-dependent enzyme [Chloroflexota bacterium]|nr:YggS family pyridoxal phosphate-dependent enzyme [Chloroflexota bacterium]
MMTQATVATRLERVRERIARAAERAGRSPDEIVLVGASKTVEPARIAAAIAAGLRDLGENYVQEAQTKQAALRGPDGALAVAPSESGAAAGGASAPVRWHLIGHLQTNKAKLAVELFDIIQSLDSDRLARALARHAAARGKQLRVLLEVDYTGLPERTGLAPDAVYPTVEAVLGLPSLALVGLMTVPALGLSAAETRATFQRLRALRDDLAARYPAADWRHLSMGMTDDFELAIEEGATMVRIGRAIFGERP